MSGSGVKKYPAQHKFPGPTDLKVPMAEDFDQEYFKKIANRKGRRHSTYPAVAISEGRIVQTYGTTVPEDITDLFYAGDETVYCISPAPPSKSKSANNTNKLPPGHIKKGPERQCRAADGQNVDLDSILGLCSIERRDEEPQKQRRQSVGVLKDRQLGRTLCRSLTSASTDTDREILKDLRVSLKTKRNSCDNVCVDLNNQYPAWASDRIYSGTDSTSLSNKERRLSSTDTSLYMANITNIRRQVSKGELKMKRLGKSTKVETPAAPPGEKSLSKNTYPKGMSLAISGKVPEVKQVKDVSSYQMRQKYADKLERNWFVDLVEKAKKKEVNGNWLQRRYDLRLEMFYSPEPDDDSDLQSDNAQGKRSIDYSHRHTAASQKEYVQDDVGNDQVFQQSFNSEINTSVKFTSRENSVSTPTVNALDKQKAPIPSLKEKRSFLQHFDSTDVLVGNVGELEESSASEIETVLHNGQLQERRCKHKMYRKRRRQKQRFETFIKVPGISDESDADEDHERQETNVTVERFSVKEIRSMRLQVKKKKAPIIKGLKKFRQIANVIYMFVQFRKLLVKIRHGRRKTRKRSKRKSKKVKWNKDLEIYTRFERQTSPAKEPTHEKFMREVGVKLLDDMAKLPITITADKPFTTYEVDVENDDETAEHQGGMSFYYEIQKVNISDISSLPEAIDIRKRERRFSEPGPARPDHITFKTPDKSTSKKSQRKSRKRSRSPRKGEKNQYSSPTALLGKAPSSLPALLAPPSPGISARKTRSKSPDPSHKHNHEHNTSPDKQKQKHRGRSVSPTKRRNSRSPAVQESKSTPRRAFKEVTIWPEVHRQRSLSVSNVLFKGEISLRELLKDADIPAKEIVIQIIERKRKRRRRKLAYAAVHQEKRDLETRKIEAKAEMERERLAELQVIEEAEKLEKDKMLRHYVSPFVSTGVAWNRKKLRPIPTWTNTELDLEITKLSGLFFEMRNCSYIRWSNKDQAILRRLAELENVRA